LAKKINLPIAPPKTYNMVKPYIGAIKNYFRSTKNYPSPPLLIGEKVFYIKIIFGHIEQMFYVQVSQT
jgi:hypothetical protein